MKISEVLVVILLALGLYGGFYAGYEIAKLSDGPLAALIVLTFMILGAAVGWVLGNLVERLLG